jgi:hypothetical protein
MTWLHSRQHYVGHQALAAQLLELILWSFCGAIKSRAQYSSPNDSSKKRVFVKLFLLATCFHDFRKKVCPRQIGLTFYDVDRPL